MVVGCSISDPKDFVAALVFISLGGLVALFKMSSEGRVAILPKILQSVAILPPLLAGGCGCSNAPSSFL